MFYAVKSFVIVNMVVQRHEWNIAPNASCSFLFVVCLCLRELFFLSFLLHEHATAQLYSAAYDRYICVTLRYICRTYQHFVCLFFFSYLLIVIYKIHLYFCFLFIIHVAISQKFSNENCCSMQLVYEQHLFYQTWQWNIPIVFFFSFLKTKKKVHRIYLRMDLKIPLKRNNRAWHLKDRNFK